jgi:hypothetical protein
MGLYAFEVEIIADLVRDIPRPCRVLSFGHPDVLASPEELEAALGQRVEVDNEGVRESRNYHPGADIIGSAKVVFDALGAELVVLDKREVYGVDGVVDLNEPIGAEHRGRYDLVIDPGTTEHIFNVAQALKNVADTVKVGGFVYHMVPLCNFNHGFWNFSPVTFTQFYSAENGFELLQMRGSRRGRWVDVNPTGKFKLSNDGIKLSLMCIARRISAAEITFPALQSKYAAP